MAHREDQMVRKGFSWPVAFVEDAPGGVLAAAPPNALVLSTAGPTDRCRDLEVGRDESPSTSFEPFGTIFS